MNKYEVIFLLPLLSFLTCSLLGRWLGTIGAQLISVLCLLGTMISTLNIAYTFIREDICRVNYSLNLWIDSGIEKVNWEIYIDRLSLVMMFLVTIVSFLVHVYSLDYMKEDPHVSRFMGYLSLFTWSMIVLVSSKNLLILFLGWEGVGVVSYLLINFWYTRIQANKSGLKAMGINRVGDLGLTLAFLAFYTIFKTLEILPIHMELGVNSSIMNSKVELLGWSIDTMTLIGIWIIVAIAGKSGQLVLHLWLPDAMEGPTPVSALIHAATMVTAGVFLLIRLGDVLSLSQVYVQFVMILGSLTIVFAGSTALVQKDLKRVIAFSTISQLGYMTLACGLGSYEASLFHLVNHGVFKALLFLSAGVIIHAMNDEQDMRRLGGLINCMPITYALLLIGSLSLMGFPYLSGYVSKEMILELSYLKGTTVGEYSYWLATIGAMLTAIYSIRLIALTFLKEPQGPKNVMKNLHESTKWMMMVMFILGILSIGVGYIIKEVMVGTGLDYYKGSLLIIGRETREMEVEYIPIEIKLIPIIGSMIGGVAGIVLYYGVERGRIWIKLRMKEVYFFLSKRWYMDKILNEYIIRGVLRCGYEGAIKSIDKGILEVIGPSGASRGISEISKVVKKSQSGNVYDYAYLILIGILILILLELVEIERREMVLGLVIFVITIMVNPLKSTNQTRI